MHNHNKNGGHKGMLWMMLPCLLLLGFLFLGGSKVIPSEYLWLVIIAVCVVPHVWMMFRGHGGHDDSHIERRTDASGQKETKDKSKHGCCH